MLIQPRCSQIENQDQMIYLKALFEKTWIENASLSLREIWNHLPSTIFYERVPNKPISQYHIINFKDELLSGKNHIINFKDELLSGKNKITHFYWILSDEKYKWVNGINFRQFRLLIITINSLILWIHITKKEN